MSISMAQSKKIIAGFFTLVSLCMLTPAAFADDSTTPAAATAAATTGTGTGIGGTDPDGPVLQQIATYTNGTMTAVNSLPAVLLEALTYMLAWTAPDTSDSTAALQSTFSSYSGQLQASSSAQNALLTQLTADYFSNGVTTTNLPNANDDSYNTLLGTPFFSPDPRVQNGGPAINSSYNYIKNASGISLVHTVPQANWTGTPNDQAKYSNYYNAISAVTTYNGYVLSQLVTDEQAGLPASQNTLLTQATTSDWFAQVASESVGIVMRQMLMYSSQTYVLLSELLTVEKQILASLAMTNTLFIANGSFSENILLRNAITKSASST
jgi:hypothetical protein